MKKEQRRCSRKLLRIEARYQDPQKNVRKGMVRNISLSGIYIETGYPLDVGSLVSLSIDAIDLGKVIDVSGRVARVEENRGMGIEFSSKDNRDIRLLLSSLRKLDQASLLSLSRSAFDE